MLGNNELVFNQATMIAAVQHYLDTVLFRKDHSPKVMNVSYNHDLFTIKVGEAE